MILSLPEPVLVVDDEAHIRRFLRLLLRQLGVERVVEAPTGDAALILAGEMEPGLVLLDINMPGRNGLETLRALKSLRPNCPVVILSSLGSRFAVQEAAESGASGYIRKDTPREEICRLLLEMFPAQGAAAEKAG